MLDAIASVAPATVELIENPPETPPFLHLLREWTILGLHGLALLVLPYISVWIVRFFADRLKLDHEQMQNVLGDRLDKALHQAIEYAVRQLRDKLGERNPVEPHIEAELADHALHYAQRHVPQTIDRLGLTPSSVLEMIFARLSAHALTRR